MLTKQMIQNCIENIDYTIKNTGEIDSAHAHKKLFQLSKDRKPLIVEYTLAEIATYLNVDIKIIRKLRENRNCRLYNVGYRITTIEYKH